MLGHEDINFKKIFLIGLVVSLIVSALIAISFFLLGDFGEIQIKILLTTLTVGLFSVTGLSNSILFEKKKFILFATIGVLFSVIGFLATTGLIWQLVDFDSNFWKVEITLIVVSFATAHLAPLLLVKEKNGIISFSKRGTIIIISLVAISILLFVWNLIDFDEFVWRIFAVLVILDVLGTLVTPILVKVYYKSETSKFKGDNS